MLKNSPGCCGRSAAWEAREPPWGADTLWPRDLSSKGTTVALCGHKSPPPQWSAFAPSGAPQVERQLSPGSVGVGLFMLLLLNRQDHCFVALLESTRGVNKAVVLLLVSHREVVQFDKCKFNSFLFMFVNNASVYCGFVVFWEGL